MTNDSRYHIITKYLLPYKYKHKSFKSKNFKQGPDETGRTVYNVICYSTIDMAAGRGQYGERYFEM